MKRLSIIFFQMSWLVGSNDYRTEVLEKNSFLLRTARSCWLGPREGHKGELSRNKKKRNEKMWHRREKRKTK